MSQATSPPSPNAPAGVVVLPPMTTVPIAVPAEAIAATADSCVVVSGVAWETYCRLADESERSGTRFTYDQGTLEIMSPSYEHELLKVALGRLIDVVIEEFDLDAIAAGSTTFRDDVRRQGYEPDLTFYFARANELRGQRSVPITSLPPADLVVEIEVTRSAVNKLALFAADGVKEVWRHNGQTLRIYTLSSQNQYEEQLSSPSLNGLLATEMQELLETRADQTDAGWLRAVRQWAIAKKAN